MTGGLQILLLVLLAAGTAALIYYLWRHWGGPSEPAADALETRASHGAAEAEDEQEVPTRPEAGDKAEHAGTAYKVEEVAEKAASAPVESTEAGALAEAASEVESHPQAGEGTEVGTDKPPFDGVDKCSPAEVEEAARPPDQESLPVTSAEELGRVSKGDSNRLPQEKVPRKYQGLTRGAPQPQDGERQTQHSDSGQPATRDRSLPIEIRLRFDRGGFCTISLIAKRSPGLPEEITVATPSGELEFRAMQDEWYQDVAPDGISRLLREGMVWTREDANGQYSWSLSGRELFVLAARHDISGYVSQPCLDLGREHVVLCSETIKLQVDEAIRATGAKPTAVLDESLGAPRGWVVFRDVVPTTPVPPVGGADVFNALRPIPRIEISLEGGIGLDYANWLEGHPPLIRVYGDPEHTADVRIDGHPASLGDDGTYRVAGWDSVGSHSVWCAGTSKSYSIIPFAASWERCDAYAFPVSYDSAKSISICGPLVQDAGAERQAQVSSISVPETNPVILGPTPGEHALATRVSGVNGTPLIASPRFRPVWALPHDPLHCDKAVVRILLIGDGKPQERERGSSSVARAGNDQDLDAWSRLILDASRKGLRTEPNTEAVRALWLSYKRVARRIWRARR